MTKNSKPALPSALNIPLETMTAEILAQRADWVIDNIIALLNTVSPWEGLSIASKVQSYATESFIQIKAAQLLADASAEQACAAIRAAASKTGGVH